LTEGTQELVPETRGSILEGHISGVVGLSITKLRKVYCCVCRGKISLNRLIFGKITSKEVVISCTLCAWGTTLLNVEENVGHNFHFCP